MGQILSNIFNRISGKAEEERSIPTPLLFPPLAINPTSILESSQSSSSFIHSTSNYVRIPPILPPSGRGNCTAGEAYKEVLSPEHSPGDSTTELGFVEVTNQILLLCEQINRELAAAEEEEEGIWMKQYCSRHRILLVGEGDFSFSASLALAFGSAHNIVATSLDSKRFFKKNYQNAMSNIHSLRSRGAKVIHGVDATEMATHPLLQHLKFDRIIFNFPLNGFFPEESRKSTLQRYRELVRLFMANAKKMVNPKGEIHITHKTNGFFKEWKVEELGLSEGLKLIEEVPFSHLDYPGYQTKYGHQTMYGCSCDHNFNCYPCKTYHFGLKKRPPRRRARKRN